MKLLHFIKQYLPFYQIFFVCFYNKPLSHAFIILIHLIFFLETELTSFELIWELDDKTVLISYKNWRSLSDFTMPDWKSLKNKTHLWSIKSQLQFSLSVLNLFSEHLRPPQPSPVSSHDPSSAPIIPRSGTRWKKAAAAGEQCFGNKTPSAANTERI